MTQGVAFTEAMKTYVLRNKDSLFYSEIAWNLTQMTGVPVTRRGVQEYLYRYRKQNGNGNGSIG